MISESQQRCECRWPATYDESLDYFRRLAAASDRIQLVEVGRTSEQRRWYFALISDPDNLANVERYQLTTMFCPSGFSDGHNNTTTLSRIA